MNLQSIGCAAQNAAYVLAVASTEQKDKALSVIADELEVNTLPILMANAKDIDAGKIAGLPDAMLDRLLLDKSRLEDISADISNVISLSDPVGSEIDCRVLRNGMTLSRRREPIGVIGVIYEARPNVTIDIASLCLKAGNASILRGGRETFHSNMELIKVIQTSLEKVGLPTSTVQYIAKPDRELVSELLRLDNYVDMIIPRGGIALCKMCKENSTIPVIIGGFGISHMYIDKSANLDRALAVIINAKVQRPSACNALDTLLVHNDIAETLLQKLTPMFNKHRLKIFARKSALPLLNCVDDLHEASDCDFDIEWLSYTLGISLVADVNSALRHMRDHNANHSDAILTNDLSVAEVFIKGAGSAVVYVNASTRFTDGAQFGLGSEVAVSTQKLHARGPMGLEDLTTYKWVGKADYLSRP
ncbi:glutamate-5-semialdehyde dehydrogenase [Candidatus Enterovibrio escicola]|uniref:glutamate-5-semialdehyde dehydrogenase n=1 Tax=Candidatus Enterovibrio escicola TaxID=1927127 RepID=UPI001237E963|nr:glutamate-5-semialdehyde dehydrogenase [Candidatus Enterovibrio escacola]